MTAPLDNIIALHFVLMSDRSHFWDPDKVSDRTEIMQKAGIENAFTDWKQFAGKKVLLLVHGFNEGAKTAIANYKTINSKITPLSNPNGQKLYDLVIGYLWPGDQEGLEFFGAIKNADSLTNRMRFHLNVLASSALQVDVLAHSMGNRLILDALDYPALPNQTPLIQNFYSLAAAVNYNSLEKGEHYFNATTHCKTVYIFHSSHDDVLKFLYLFAERAAALGFKVEPNTLKPPNVQFVDCSQFVKGHSGYFDALPLYEFIQKSQT